MVSGQWSVLLSRGDGGRDRVLLEGVATKRKKTASRSGAKSGNDFMMYNPVYELL